MRNIKAYKFVELNPTVQLVIINKYRTEINDDVIEWMNETWYENVAGLSAMSFIKSISIYLHPTSISVTPYFEDNVEHIYKMTPTEAKVYLKRFTDSLIDNENYPLDLYNIAKQMEEEYDESPLLVYVVKFLNNLVTGAYEWLLKFITDDEYTKQYITRDVKEKYIVPTEVLRYREFTENGEVIQII